MSVLIPGMEMPNNCRECPLETDYGTCGYYSLFVEAGHESSWETRREDCPLVPVPEHGDLIDRQAFRYEMDKRYPFDNATQRRHGIEDVLKSAVLRMLFDAPTVIPADPAEEGE